jgi:hypothetical protein
MKIEFDLGKIITSILLAIILYMGNTIYELDKEQKLINYNIDMIHEVLKDLYEIKAKR